jgi:hypothetical protein
MSRRAPVRLIVATAWAVSLTACSGQSPLEPSATGANGGPAARIEAVAGTYDLTFWARVDGTYQIVSSLPVQGPAMVLRADVSAGGIAATQGTVVFEYCSYKKGPANDINRPDEAPKEACEDGSTASWARLRSVTIDGDGGCRALGGGSACALFGSVQIPRTVGFRYRFSGQRSGIASGTSPALNFTWVPQS